MQFHTTGIVLAALTIVSAASAQTTQAVEWKVSEGGNGHWYAISPELRTWEDAKVYASQSGGTLAAINSAAEGNFVRALTTGTYWIGLYQDGAARDFAEPAGGWRWVTDEPVSFSDWGPGYNGLPQEPNNYFPDEDYALVSSQSVSTQWFDVRGSQTWPTAVEWSTDCNGDGIVDYGQILRGELIDLNANGVPDICETSVSSVIPPSVPSQGGSTVTIRGNGFQDNPTVRIGGVPATNIARVSLTEITATSPALLPGMASVQVNDFTLQDGIYIRPDCGSDLDQNGAVDGGDMAILLLDWGPCYTTPSALAAPAPTPLLLPDESTPASTPPAPQSARQTPQPRGTAS